MTYSHLSLTHTHTISTQGIEQDIFDSEHNGERTEDSSISHRLPFCHIHILRKLDTGCMTRMPQMLDRMRYCWIFLVGPLREHFMPVQIWFLNISHAGKTLPVKCAYSELGHYIISSSHFKNLIFFLSDALFFVVISLYPCICIQIYSMKINICTLPG